MTRLLLPLTLALSCSSPPDDADPSLPTCTFDTDCPVLYGYMTCQNVTPHTGYCTFACQTDRAEAYCGEVGGSCVGPDAGLAFCEAP